MIKQSLTILALAVCLHACSSAPKPLTKVEEFELKTRCSGYLDSVEKREEVMGAHVSVDELFYSPKLNTCVAAFRTFDGDNRGFRLQDILESHTNYFFDEYIVLDWNNRANSNSDEGWKREDKKFEAKIEELKADTGPVKIPN